MQAARADIHDGLEVQLEFVGASAPRKLDSSSKWRAAVWFIASLKNW
jgi:hypothetical protein